MRLESAKLNAIATEMVHALTTEQAIEVDSEEEVRLDIEAVLAQYLRDEQEISDKAKDLITARNLSPSEFGKMKRAVADQRRFKLGEEAVDYLLDQLVEMMMHSTNVVEVFAEDVDLRRLLRAPLRKQLEEEDRLDVEIRAKLKHVKEPGGTLWEIEYQRIRDDIKRRRGH